MWNALERWLWGEPVSRRSVAHDAPPEVADAMYRLSRRIRSAREDRGWTQQVFADRMGVSRTTVVQVEQGKLGSAIATYACALHELGMLDGFELLADPDRDPEAAILAALDAEQGPAYLGD
ncbi:MAG: helix-turn-helix transcriptional regulator [Gemmatimonadota bacterium]|nr:helix-turn-helix transcriptional regulator [Gemmatimonadota bacterium]